MVLYGKVAGYPWKIEIQTYYKPFKIVKSMIIFQNLWHNRLREAVFSAYLTGHKFQLQFANSAKINIVKTLCSEAAGHCERLWEIVFLLPLTLPHNRANIKCLHD